MGDIGSRWEIAPRSEQPRAVILDPKCRAPLRKLRKHVSKQHIPQPWIVCRDDIQKFGDEYIRLTAEADGKFKWKDILSALSAKGVKQVLIEGGGVVINDILDQGLANVIIFSISPVLLGRDGVEVSPRLLNPKWLDEGIKLGRDCIFAARCRDMK